MQAFDYAARELEATRQALRDHPEVLEVRWALAANPGNWPEALAIAVSLTALPRAYDKPLYEQKCSALFEHVYESYPERDAGVYAEAV